jgi:pimeloyl-ACP methyl ester carboxylesterase
VSITGSPASYSGDRSAKGLVATQELDGHCQNVSSEPRSSTTTCSQSTRDGAIFRPAPPYAFARSVSFDPRREFVNDCRPCLAHDVILGIRASRTTDCADNIALVDQRNPTSRRNDSIKGEQIVRATLSLLDMHLDAKNRAERNETLTSGRRTRSICKNGGGLSVNGAKQMHIFTSPRLDSSLRVSCMKLVVAVTLASFQLFARVNEKEHSMKYPTLYRKIQIDGLSIFYREAGPKDAPTILLLHGLPSSSRMFEPLFARLSDRYHLVAPDYPGFGHSDWPDPKTFAYTLDHYAEIMNHFTEALGLSRYTLYIQDYGGPVGFRMFLAHPERVETLIVQTRSRITKASGQVGRRGGPFGPIAFRTKVRCAQISFRWPPHVRAMSETTRMWIATTPISGPTNFYFLNQPGQAEIQSDLFYDYRTNVDAYPKWQAWMLQKQPRLLVIWGKYELSFDAGEPERYHKDVPNAEVHIVDGGRFALDTAADEIAALVQGFVGSSREGVVARRAG